MTAPAISTTDEAVYATVSYADVFDMPIQLNHLHRYLVGSSLTMLETSMAVDSLVEKKQLSCRDDLIYLAGRDEVVTIYDERTKRAASLWNQAEKWGQRIGRIPLVRMVAVAGGLAAGSVVHHNIIEYFVVVRPRRLWLTRRLMMALGRLSSREGIALRPNFIVTTRSLDMEERSMYIARELAQMAVIVGDSLCQSVRRSNSWMFEYLPNATLEGDRTHLSAVAPTRAQRWAEWLLLLPPFWFVESWERKRMIIELTTVPSSRPQAVTPDESWFSAEVCKGHLVSTAAGIDAAWKERLET